MSRTPEEMAEEYTRYWWPDYNDVKTCCQTHLATRQAFLAGYKAAMDEVEAYKDGAKDVAKKFNELIAAKDQVANVSKVITYDYVETASNEAKELIAQFELKGDEDVLVKALVAAYCRGVDAVDGHLRNSLSAYRNSVKQQQWISVKDRLPDGCDPGGDCDYEIKDYPYVLAYSPTDGIHVAYYDTHRGVFETSATTSAYAEELYKVTHWQPLPAPPKEEE